MDGTKNYIIYELQRVWRYSTIHKHDFFEPGATRSDDSQPSAWGGGETGPYRRCPRHRRRRTMSGWSLTQSFKLQTTTRYQSHRIIIRSPEHHLIWRTLQSRTSSPPNRSLRTRHRSGKAWVLSKEGRSSSPKLVARVLVLSFVNSPISTTELLRDARFTAALLTAETRYVSSCACINRNCAGGGELFDSLLWSESRNRTSQFLYWGFHNLSS